MIKVVIVDDHPAIQQAWLQFLNAEEDIEVVGVFSSGNEMVEKLNEISTDIILMDISMPGISGIEATRRITKINPSVKIIAVTTYDASTYQKKTMDAGAKGFVSKYAVAEHLIKAIKEVYKGNIYLAKDAAD